MLLCTILGAVSYTLIDWNNYEKGISNAIKELRLTIVFLGLAFYFTFPYVRKLKKSKKDS